MRDNLPLPSKSPLNGDNREMQESQASHHFSIRGYVSEIRKMDRYKCWPFSPMKELPDSLPPMVVPNFRWWGCKGCLSMNDQTDKDRESLIPDASKRDDRMPRGQLSPIEEHPDPLHERENDVDQEPKRDDWISEGQLSALEDQDPLQVSANDMDQDCSIEDPMLPDVSENCLFKIDKVSENASEDRISEGQLYPTEEDQDPLHARENDQDQECDMQDSTTLEVNLGGKSTETDLPTHSGNDVENKEAPASNSPVGRPGSSNLYYSRRPRKIRTLADIMKNKASNQDEFTQKRKCTDNDEALVPQFRGKTKFLSRKRRCFSGGERKGPLSSFKILLKRSERTNSWRLGRVPKRAKKLEDLEEIEANISKEVVTATDDIVSILSSQAITTARERISLEEETGISKESEGGNSVRTLGREEKAAVYETNPILDDIPIEILELLQTNFQKKHQQNLGRSAADVAQSSGANNETRDSQVTYLRHQSLPGRAPRRSKKPKRVKDRSFTSAQNKPIEAHLGLDPFAAPYPCSCYSKVNSYASLISEKENYESGSKETLSAMQLLRLMDPAVPLSLERDVGSFDSFVAHNWDTPNQTSSLGTTSLNSFTTFGNFPSLDGREQLSSNSRKKRRIKNPGSRQGKLTSNSIQLDFKNRGGAADPLRGGQPELGFCALNMNPADFYTVNARSKLYMISYKDLRPKMKKQPAVFPDIREREMLPEG